MSGWFGKRELPTITHEHFGELKLEHGVWWGEIQFPPACAMVQVAIDDDGGQPVSGAWTVVQELGRRWNELSGPFAVELRTLLEPWQQEFSKDRHPLEEGDQLFARFQVEALDIGRTGISVVAFCLKQGWDDARFRLSLDDWIPKALGVDE
jgi:hypothetical protein